MRAQLTKYLSITGAVLLLAILLFLVRSSSGITSPVVDETTEVAAGYYMLRTGDFTNNTGNPILLSILSALPLLSLDLTLPAHPTPYFPPGTYSDTESWLHSIAFLAANQAQVESIFASARLMILLQALIAGLFVYRWAGALYGRLAALTALLFFIFSPNILAHAGVGTYDMGFTLFFLVGCYCLQQLIFTPRLIWLLAAGVATGLVLLAKNTAPLFLIVAGAFALLTISPAVGTWHWLPASVRSKWIGRFGSYLLSGLGVAVLAVVVVNIGYGFAGTFAPLSDIAPGIATAEHRFAAIANLRLPLPASYVEAFLYRLSHASRGQRSFLWGYYGLSIAYHPITVLTKVPVAMLITLPLVATLTTRTHVVGLRWRAHEVALLLPPLIIFVAVTLGNIKVGFRHLLPMMPFLFIFAGKLLAFVTTAWQQKEQRNAPSVLSKLLPSTLAIGLIGWYIVSSTSVYPHYLAYFNEIAGGPDNGHRILVDSNLDWGQNLKGLKSYMVEHDIDRVKLSYFGSADPAWYDIAFDYLPSIGLRQPGPDGLWWYEPGYVEDCTPQTGTIAISATNLQGVLLQDRHCFDWLHSQEPVAKVGYSIFIYEVE